MYIGIGNHEYRNVNYSVETWMVRTEFENITNTSSIVAMEPVDQLSIPLAHNSTTLLPYNLSVKNTGYNQVIFLLFKESKPGPDVMGSDRIRASYRDLNMMVTIRDTELSGRIHLGQYRQNGNNIAGRRIY